MLRLGIILLLMALDPARLAAAWTWQGTTEAIWHGNVTNSDRPADRLSALQWQTGLTVDFSRPLPGGNRASAGLRVGLACWPKYQGLDSLTLEPTLGLNHKFGLGAQAWVVSANTSGGWVGVHEADRSGLSRQLHVEVSKRWGESWQFFLGTERARYDARGHAFSNSGRDNYLRGAYQLNDVWTASLEIRQRAGIVVSYTSPPRPDLVLAGKVLTLVDTFERGSQLLAYYFPADTQSASLELTRTLSPAASLFLRFEYRNSTHKALRYLNQRSMLGVVRRF